jgi:hypothetical protein
MPQDSSNLHVQYIDLYYTQTERNMSVCEIKLNSRTKIFRSAWHTQCGSDGVSCAHINCKVLTAGTQK